MTATVAAKTSDQLSAYQRLASYIEDELIATDHLIVDRLRSHIPIIPKLAGHLISAGGKRVRPLLTLASTRLCEGNFSRAIPLAACIEFIHTATLLHDDVIDESSTRRGQPSANAIWGNQASVLVGDYLFGRSFELMVEDGHLEVLQILSKVSSTIIEGEILQLSASYDFKLADQHYTEIIRSKTGQLFSAACEVGAAVSDVGLEKQKALADYGMYVGMAFQCIDDLLDYFTDEKTMGKKPGDDFREGKITLPILIAYKKTPDSEKAFWEERFSENAQTDQAFEDVKQALMRDNIYDDVKNIAMTYVRRAQKALEAFPNTVIKTDFYDFAEYCVIRAF